MKSEAAAIRKQAEKLASSFPAIEPAPAAARPAVATPPAPPKPAPKPSPAPSRRSSRPGTRSSAARWTCRSPSAGPADRPGPAGLPIFDLDRPPERAEASPVRPGRGRDGPGRRVLQAGSGEENRSPPDPGWHRHRAFRYHGQRMQAVPSPRTPPRLPPDRAGPVWRASRRASSPAGRRVVPGRSSAARGRGRTTWRRSARRSRRGGTTEAEAGLVRGSRDARGRRGLADAGRPPGDRGRDDEALAAFERVRGPGPAWTQARTQVAEILIRRRDAGRGRAGPPRGRRPRPEGRRRPPTAGLPPDAGGRATTRPGRSSGSSTGSTPDPRHLVTLVGLAAADRRRPRRGRTSWTRSSRGRPTTRCSAGPGAWCCSGPASRRRPGPHLEAAVAGDRGRPGRPGRPGRVPARRRATSTGSTPALGPEPARPADRARWWLLKGPGRGGPGPARPGHRRLPEGARGRPRRPRGALPARARPWSAGARPTRRRPLLDRAEAVRVRGLKLDPGARPLPPGRRRRRRSSSSIAGLCRDAGPRWPRPGPGTSRRSGSTRPGPRPRPRLARSAEPPRAARPRPSGATRGRPRPPTPARPPARPSPPGRSGSRTSPTGRAWPSGTTPGPTGNLFLGDTMGGGVGLIDYDERRPARRLLRQRLPAARSTAGDRPRAEPALPEPGRRHVRGRHRPGRGRRARLRDGLRRGRLRQRRPRRPVRHRARPDGPLPEPGRRHVRGRHRPRPASARTAGRPPPGSATSTATATSTWWSSPTSRPTRRTSPTASTRPASRSTARPASSRRSSTTSSATTATARSPTSAARRASTSPAASGLGLAIADLDDDGKLDLFVANDAAPNFLFRNLGGLKFEEVGVTAGRRLRRRRPGHGQHGGRGRGPRRRRPDRPVPRQLPQRGQHPAPQPRRRPVRRRHRRRRARRDRPDRRPASAPWPSTPRTTAGSTCSSPTATSTTAPGPTTRWPSGRTLYRARSAGPVRAGRRRRSAPTSPGRSSAGGRRPATSTTTAGSTWWSSTATPRRPCSGTSTDGRPLARPPAGRRASRARPRSGPASPAGPAGRTSTRWLTSGTSYLSVERPPALVRPRGRPRRSTGWRSAGPRGWSQAWSDLPADRVLEIREGREPAWPGFCRARGDEALRASGPHVVSLTSCEAISGRFRRLPHSCATSSFRNCRSRSSAMSRHACVRIAGLIASACLVWRPGAAAKTPRPVDDVEDRGDRQGDGLRSRASRATGGEIVFDPSNYPEAGGAPDGDRSARTGRTRSRRWSATTR